MILFAIYQIILFIGLTFSNSCCYCQNAYFKLEHEDTSVIKTNDVMPFLEESVKSEMECYMKCLANKDICCMIEMKENEGETNHCLLYDISSVYLSMTVEENSTVAVVVDRDCKLKPESCLEWYQKGRESDGVYDIYVDGNLTKAFCDMTTNGGGWTVIQRRFNGSIGFSRTWNEYKNGFGDPSGEYWLGNGLIHQLTNKVGGTLIKLEATSLDSVSKYIIYNGFKIDGKKNRYKLGLGNATEGDAFLLSLQDGLIKKSGSNFTTKDWDNDQKDNENCAISTGAGGGFWYKACTNVSPNGEYPSDDSCDKNVCMRWSKWREEEPYTLMKFFKISIK